MHIDASQENVFSYLMDFYADRKMRILTSDSPSYIRTEFGSYSSFAIVGIVKGELETQITKKDGESDVCLNFSFKKEYISTLAAALIGIILIIVVGLPITNIMIQDLPGRIVEATLTRMYSILILASACLHGISMGLEIYVVSRTKDRVRKELTMSLESLQAFLTGYQDQNQRKQNPS